MQFIGQMQRIEQFALSSFLANNSGTVNPWTDSTVMPVAKVNCRLWVTVHFALVSSFLRNEIRYAHTLDTHSSLLYSRSCDQSLFAILYLATSCQTIFNQLLVSISCYLDPKSRWNVIFNVKFKLMSM